MSVLFWFIAKTYWDTKELQSAHGQRSVCLGWDAVNYLLEEASAVCNSLNGCSQSSGNTMNMGLRLIFSDFVLQWK